MRTLFSFGQLALGALACSLVFTAAVTSTDLSDSPVIDPAVVLAGWSDQLGSAVTNVGVLDFTAATHISRGWFTPPNPAWLAGAAQFDGAWTPAGWQVVTATSGGRGTLLMALNRSTLTNRLWLGVAVVASSDAELYVDLLDTNAVPVAVNLLGNLVGPGTTRTNVLTTIPLVDYPAATVIALRRGKGAITVPLALLAVAELPVNPAITGATADNGTSARNSLAAGVGALSAASGATSEPAITDATITSGQAPTNAVPARAAVTWYVNSTGGHDGYSGRSLAWNGQHGPFATLHKAIIGTAKSGDTVVVAGGVYGEDLENGEPGVKVLINGDVHLNGPGK